MEKNLKFHKEIQKDAPDYIPIQWKKATSALMSINALFWHNKQKQCPGDGYTS